MLKKIKYILFSGIFLISLVSCTRDIPEGDIKDFVEQITYNRAYQHVETGTSKVQLIYTINNKEEGIASIITQIDRNSGYYYLDVEASGSYIDEYKYQSQQTLCYTKEDKDTVVSYKKTDGNLEDVSYSLDELEQFMITFFFTQLEGGYHQGAVYYGDYVVANCAKFYSCFSLNEEKTELTYEVNTSSKNSEGEEILTMHHFVIDAYGMILSLHTKSMLLEKNIVIDTTIECEYNVVIDKKLEI